MDGEYGTCGLEDECLQGFGVEGYVKEAAWKNEGVGEKTILKCSIYVYKVGIWSGLLCSL